MNSKELEALAVSIRYSMIRKSLRIFERLLRVSAAQLSIILEKVVPQWNVSLTSSDKKPGQDST